MKLFWLSFLLLLGRVFVPIIIMICDPNHNDLDDESALVVIASMIRLKYVKLLAAIIANTNPETKRASVARGLMNLLGFKNVAVGIGDRVTQYPEPFPDEPLIPYMYQGEDLPDGKELLVHTLKHAKDNSITIVVQAAMTEVMWLLKDHGSLFLTKVKRVVFMGGVAPELSPEGFILPGDAMNVHFDKEAAAYCYHTLQLMRVPMTITTRNATFKAMLNHKIFKKMGIIGESFESRVGRNTQRFWVSCCSPEGSKERGKLSMSRNRAWFIQTFCGGIDPGIEDGKNILPFIVNDAWPQYDPLNLIAAVPFLRDIFFKTKVIKVGGVKHLVVGWSAEEHGVRSTPKTVSFLESLLEFGSR